MHVLTYTRNIGAVPLLTILVPAYILDFAGKMRRDTTNKQAEPKGNDRATALSLNVFP